MPWQYGIKNRVKRQYHIQENKRFQEIRQQGKSYSSELLVMGVLSNELPYSRFGFSINARIGGAVVRNRLKRRLREAIRLRMATIEPGWDVVFIARSFVPIIIKWTPLAPACSGGRIYCARKSGETTCATCF